jgi:hypothetical protein
LVLVTQSRLAQVEPKIFLLPRATTRLLLAAVCLFQQLVVLKVAKATVLAATLTAVLHQALLAALVDL